MAADGGISMKANLPGAAASAVLIAITACSRAPAPGTEPVAPQMPTPAERVLNASPYSIAADPELNAFVETTAKAAIAEHCASCHGADLHGKPGVPNLVDYDWLWGITLDESSDVGPVMEIEQTVLYGVRNKDCPDIADLSIYGGCIDTRFSEMPAYGDTATLNDDQIHDLTEYVVSLSGGDADQDAVERARPLWTVCTECHGENGEGYKPYGGPDLTDRVWLYGSDRATISDVIHKGRMGVCPPWGKTLDPATIKALAVYIYHQSMGG
jgi:cytochrome c oxidase cbb3-type subunit III